MVELLKQDIQVEERQSSKGNQLKWQNKDTWYNVDRHYTQPNGHPAEQYYVRSTWYKADYMGYEGLAEYMVSGILKFSNLESPEFVSYETEEIRYGNTQYLGCKSKDFLPEGWQLITLERLFKTMYNQSLQQSLYRIEGYEKRAGFIVEQTERITGLKEFGIYLCKLLTIDAFFLNEDRHMHNIAVLMDEQKKFHLCPFFDHGAALLSDTTMDYPLAGNVLDMMKQVSAKTFCDDFDVQLDAVERLYGQQVHFSFGRKEVEALLEEEPYYPQEVKERVLDILMEQRRKYAYLFQ